MGYSPLGEHDDVHAGSRTVRYEQTITGVIGNGSLDKVLYKK
jgi:hypothetical protein